MTNHRIRRTKEADRLAEIVVLIFIMFIIFLVVR